jgi:uncharacterized membrane protein
MMTFHSQDGRHFLGLRSGRQGFYEIVYEGGPQRRRFVWQIKSPHVDTANIQRQLYDAIRAVDVLTTLYSGLRSEEIEFEIDYD